MKGLSRQLSDESGKMNVLLFFIMKVGRSLCFCLTISKENCSNYVTLKSNGLETFTHH